MFRFEGGSTSDETNKREVFVVMTYPDGKSVSVRTADLDDLLGNPEISKAAFRSLQDWEADHRSKCLDDA